MAIPFIESYKKGVHGFPSDDIAFTKKDEKWHKEYALAVLTDYANDKCGIAYSKRESIILNRKFADGTNSEEPYKEVLLEFQADQQEKKAFTNIDFQIVPVIAQFKSVFLGIIGGNEHRVVATSIDPFSMTQKAKKKWKLWIKKTFQQQIAEIDQNLGIPPTDGEFIPKSKAELQMFDQMGGFKLGLEEALEKAMNHSFYVSRWNEEVMNAVNGSFFDNNLAAVRDYLDPVTMTVKQRYVDVANLIVQHDVSHTFEKSRYFGEVTNYTIADLRAETGWDEEKIMKIASEYRGIYGNSSMATIGNGVVGTQYGPYADTNRTEYDSFVVPVLDLEFASTMYEYDVERRDEGGNKSYYRTAYDRKYNRADRKSITTPIKVWHRCKLVLGTNDVFDFGLQFDIPRPSHDDARSSFHVVKLPGRSLCERAQPHAKQIQLFYNQMQNHIAKAPPSGISVDWRSLQGVNIGGDKDASAMELLRIRNQTGNLIYASTTARGQMASMSSHPIQELRSGISQDIIVFMNLIEHHVAAIREITGVNDKAGAIPSQTATGAKLSVMANDISLKTIYQAYLAIVKETAINSCARLRDLLAYSEEAREIYEPILGMNSIELLDIVSDLPTASIAIKIEVKVKDEDKEQIRAALMAAMKPGKNGYPALSVSEYLMIEGMLNAGNLKLAQAFIAGKEAERDQRDLMKERENQKLNSEIGMAIEQQKQQGELAKNQLATDNEAKIQQQKYDLEDRNNASEHERKKELLYLENAMNNPPQVPMGS